MKPWIKILIGVVSGFAGGFATGFLFHKKLNDIEFVEIDEEEMKKIEDDLGKGKEETKVSQSVVEKYKSVQDLPENEDELRNALQGKVSYIKADQEAKAKFKETWETIKDYSDEENADSLPVEDFEDGMDEEFLEMLETEEVEPGQVEPPHAISLSEFYNERPEYDKITIEWYEEDDVYLDENEEIIADISSYVGLNAGKLFKDNGPDEDPDVRFVRNESYGSDYEIVRHHSAYSDISGVGEE